MTTAVGGALGGTAGAAGAYNEVTNNYLSSKQWHDFADEMDACKRDGCSDTDAAAIRAKYQDISTQQNIALANCKDDCDALRKEVLGGTETMLELLDRLPIGGAVGNDLGQSIGQRLANDPAYRATVNESIEVLNRCNANPDACTQQAITAAALVVFPLMGIAGTPVTWSSVGIGGTIGATANVGGQLYSKGNVDPVDAAMAFAAGTLTYGSSLWPALFVNVSGTTAAEGIKGVQGTTTASDSKNSIAGAVVGTAVGYPVGAGIETGLNSALNPWYRSMWQDMGYTIQKWVGPSTTPMVGGSIGGSIFQEIGNAWSSAPGTEKK